MSIVSKIVNSLQCSFCANRSNHFPTPLPPPLVVCGFGGNDKNTVTAKQKDEISVNEKVLDILFQKNEAISLLTVLFRLCHPHILPVIQEMNKLS